MIHIRNNYLCKQHAAADWLDQIQIQIQKSFIASYLHQ